MLLVVLTKVLTYFTLVQLSLRKLLLITITCSLVTQNHHLCFIELTDTSQLVLNPQLSHIGCAKYACYQVDFAFVYSVYKVFTS